jgi:hypothetical protein
MIFLQQAEYENSTVRHRNTADVACLGGPCTNLAHQADTPDQSDCDQRQSLPS